MLQQINLSYDAEQDRLLLRAREDDNTEYRIWLTRRFTALLLDVLRQRMSALGGQNQLASNPKTVEQLKGGAFHSAYQEEAPSVLPLGEEGILAYRLNYSFPSGDLSKLQLLPKQGEGLNFSLGKHMLYLLFNLLEQNLPQTGWNLGEVPVPTSLLH
jgi:hypothetical protein